MRQRGNVIGVLKKDGGLGIGVGDAAAAVPLGVAYHGLRGYIRLGDDGPLLRGLGDVRVLAKRAAQVAPWRGDGIGLAARVDVEQGLFLDGIDGLGDRSSIDERVECAAVVAAHLAESQLAVSDATPLHAEVTTHLGAVQSLVEESLPHGDALSTGCCR